MDELNSEILELLEETIDPRLLQACKILTVLDYAISDKRDLVDKLSSHRTDENQAAVRLIAEQIQVFDFPIMTVRSAIEKFRGRHENFHTCMSTPGSTETRHLRKFGHSDSYYSEYYLTGVWKGLIVPTGHYPRQIMISFGPPTETAFATVLFDATLADLGPLNPSSSAQSFHLPLPHNVTGWGRISGQVPIFSATFSPIAGNDSMIINFISYAYYFHPDFMQGTAKWEDFDSHFVARMPFHMSRV